MVLASIVVEERVPRPREFFDLGGARHEKRTLRLCRQVVGSGAPPERQACYSGDVFRRDGLWARGAPAGRADTVAPRGTLIRRVPNANARRSPEPHLHREGAEGESGLAIGQQDTRAELADRVAAPADGSPGESEGAGMLAGADRDVESRAERDAGARLVQK